MRGETYSEFALVERARDLSLFEVCCLGLDHREPNLVDKEESRRVEVCSIKHAEVVDVPADCLYLNPVGDGYASTELSRVGRERLDLSLLIEVKMTSQLSEVIFQEGQNTRAHDMTQRPVRATPRDQGIGPVAEQVLDVYEY